MVIRSRWSIVVVVILAVMLGGGGLAQVTGSFDDDDPDNDPNACHAVSAPEDCDWERGWFQAAVNMGHVSLEAARTRYPDMQSTDWLPEEERARREDKAREDAELFTDDDPTNDPNTCFESDEPNCDWVRGWYNAIYDTSTNLPEDEEDEEDEASKALRENFLAFLEARRLADLADPLGPGNRPGSDSTGTTTSATWLCPPGIEGCPRPANVCGPGDNYLLGECYLT